MKKCKCGSKDFIMVEYGFNHKDHYDGTSEYKCTACGTRYGRWSLKELDKNQTEPPYGDYSRRYLQSYSSSTVYPYKVCLICKSKIKLMQILAKHDGVKKVGSKPRCGYIGFLYFKKIKDALAIRTKYYTNKSMYVLIQNDKEIIKHYENTKI